MVQYLVGRNSTRMILLKLAFVSIIALVSTAELGHIRKVETQFQGRIAGGSIASENQFPYQAGLSIEITNGQFTWCGGSLISKQWILTAAHCVDNMKSITVYLGSAKRLEPTKVFLLTLSNVRLHFAWRSGSLENDIALLHLPSAVSYSETIQPVALPRMAAIYSSYVYHEATASGWGRISDSSTAISNELRFVKRFVESNAECQLVYGSSVRSTNICLDTTGGKSTCAGDSGGPLIVNDGAGANDAILIGLSSFGISSGCTKGYPAVFTRVTSYLDWIQETSGVANL